MKSCGPGIPTLMLSRADDDQCDDGGQQARCTEEITYKSSTHRAGNAGCSAGPVVTAACIFFCRRAMGCGQRPAFPAPSLSFDEGMLQSNSGIAGRENAASCLQVTFGAGLKLQPCRGARVLLSAK